MDDPTHTAKTPNSYQVDAQRLRALREAQGHTQRSLADAAGLDKNVVHNAENEKRIRLTSIKQLCDALGEDVCRLIKKHPDSHETSIEDHTSPQLSSSNGRFTSLKLLLEDLNGEDDVQKINDVLIEVVQMFAERKAEIKAEITDGRIGSVHLTVTFESDIAKQLAAHFPRNQAGELVINETTLRLAEMKQCAREQSIARYKSFGSAGEPSSTSVSARTAAAIARIGSAVSGKASADATAEEAAATTMGQPTGTAPESTIHDVESHERDRIGSPLTRETFFRCKYVVDRLLGGALLVLMSPLTLLLFALVKLTSPGPGFYRQERVGLHGKTFFVVKLRTMRLNSERPGQAVWLIPNDPRVTRLGRFLRSLHLDELPQLYNVAKGEMCLVGPRPERPKICQELAKHIDGYYERNSVKPGITGLAQINLPPDETIEDVRRKQILDLKYIAEANAWLDIRMMLVTAMRMFGFKGEKLIQIMGLGRQELFSEHSLETETNSGVDQRSPYDDAELLRFGAESESYERVDEWTLCQH